MRTDLTTLIWLIIFFSFCTEKSSPTVSLKVAKLMTYPHLHSIHDDIFLHQQIQYFYRFGVHFRLIMFREFEMCMECVSKCSSSLNIQSMFTKDLHFRFPYPLTSCTSWLLKSPAFYTPDAHKRDPFRAEPPLTKRPPGRGRGRVRRT